MEIVEGEWYNWRDMESRIVEGVRVAGRGDAAVEGAWVVRLALAALVLGSVGLRLFALGWGIPNFDPARMPASAYRNSYHLDEDNFLWGLMQMRPSEGNFDVADYHWGTLQHYLIYGTLLAGEGVGVLPSPWEMAFQQGDIEAIPKLYLLGRLVSIAAGAICTLVVFALGRVVAGRLAGLAAAVGYAVAPVAVVEAHYLTNDVVMSALVAGSVLCGALAVARGQSRWLFGAGLLLGLGVADKYSAVFALPSLLVAQWLCRRGARSGGAAGSEISSAAERAGAASSLSILLLPLVGLVAGFLVGEPYALISPGRVVDGLRQVAQGNGVDVSLGIRQVLKMPLWEAANLGGLGLTWPLALLSVGGLGLMLWRIVRTVRGREGAGADGGEDRRGTMMPAAGVSLVIMAGLAGLAGSMLLNRVPMLRYSQPLVPLLVVAAGVGWAAIPWAGVRAGAGVLAVGVAGIITLGQLSLMAGQHPANDLLAWLQGHYSAGQTVARLWPEYPPLDGGSYNLVRLDPWRAQMPEGVRPDYIIMDDMALGPAEPALTSLLAREYQEVARFGARPSVGPFSWDEGETPHDWKYSHPTFIVYAPLR